MTPLHGAGPQTAGMLRISKGQEERHVWPVHLSGWLAIGWRVVGAKEPAALEDFGAVEEGSGSTTAFLAQELELEQETAGDAKPASTRSRRGRRRKEEQPPGATESTPEQTGTSAETGAADPELPAATDLAAESATDSGDDSIADGELALTALPEGLFDDALI